MNLASRAIVNQITTTREESDIGQRQAPGDLIHPEAIGCARDSHHLNTPLRHPYDEEHVLGDEPARRPHLGGEEVRGG